MPIDSSVLDSKIVSIIVHKRPGPIKSSVPSPNYFKISSQPTSSTLRYQMGDLFKRRKRLADWIKRVNDDVDKPEIEQIYLKTH